MKRLLLIIDYQEDFVDGALGFPDGSKLDAPIAAKIAAYRAAGDAVAFTLDTHGEDYLSTQEGAQLPVPHCLAGTKGHALYGAVGRARLPEDVVIEKPAFPSLALGNWLQAEGFDRIELCGLVSYICVLSNAIVAKAALPECEIVVDASCTDGADKVLHEKALDLMETLQMTVVNRP